MRKVFDDYRVLSDETLKLDEPRVEKFLQALKQSLQQRDKWTFWLPYTLSLDTCMKCGTCAEVCPVAIDNGVIAREARKIFDAIDIAPDELKKNGTQKQAGVGNATGTPANAFLDMIEFLEEEIEDTKGYQVKIPVDKEGAEHLVMHNAGDYLAFAETVMGVAEVMAPPALTGP